jgi:AcrR family transcriptional regulator
MPRPRSRTTTDIAAAALSVIDRDGLTGLSINAVARELHMGTMSLYRYFDTREQLEHLVVDLLFNAIDVALPARAGWKKRVTILLERLRATVSAHPAAVPLLLTHRFTADSALAWSEALMAALRDAGFNGRQRFMAFRLLSSYVIGAIQTEHLGPLPREGTPLSAELHAAEYPLLARNAAYARQSHPDDEFHRGLAIVLSGLNQQV